MNPISKFFSKMMTQIVAKFMPDSLAQQANVIAKGAERVIIDDINPLMRQAGAEGIVLLKNAETEQGSNFLGSNRRFRHAGCSNRRSNHFSKFPENAENHNFEQFTLEYTQKSDDSMTVLNSNLSFTFSNRIL